MRSSRRPLYREVWLGAVWLGAASLCAESLCAAPRYLPCVVLSLYVVLVVLLGAVSSPWRWREAQLLSRPASWRRPGGEREWKEAWRPR